MSLSRNIRTTEIRPEELSLAHYRAGGAQGEAPSAAPRASLDVEPDESNPFFAALDDDAWAAVDSDVRASITSSSERPAAVVLEDDTEVDEAADLVAWLEAQDWSEFAQSLARQARSGMPLSERQIASASSMRLKCEGRAQARAERLALADAAAERAAEIDAAIGRVLQDRIYKVASGRIYKVQAGKESGNLYAKVLGKSGRFDYEPGAIHDLRADDTREVISIVDAIEFGHRFGTCICCSRTLTAGKSVEAGIGPVCSSKWGLSIDDEGVGA